MQETQTREARDPAGGTRESLQCPGMLGRSQRRQLRPRYVWNVERRESPESFRRQGRLGKGVWAAISKGPRGIPGQ